MVATATKVQQKICDTSADEAWSRGGARRTRRSAILDGAAPTRTGSAAWRDYRQAPTGLWFSETGTYNSFRVHQRPRRTITLINAQMVSRIGECHPGVVSAGIYSC